MKKLIGSMTALALLIPMPATMAQQNSVDRIRSTPVQWDLCRRPAALPKLGPEVEQQQQKRPRIERRSAVMPAPPPMAAPLPPPASGEAGDGDVIAVTGTAADSSSFASAAPVAVAEAESGSPGSKAASERRPTPGIMPPRPYPQPQPQSGLLTAGEHDDLLNPELYSEYVRRSNVGQAARDVPRVDTERMLTVEVKNKRGQAMPFVPIEVRCANGKSITLKSVANGRSVFFPELDRLGSSVQIRAGRSKWKTVNLPRSAGSKTIGFTLGGSAERVTKLDLALVVDVTGSMSDELRFLQSELTAIVDSLNRKHRGLDIQVGFIFYRDQRDTFVTRTFPLDRNIAAGKRRIMQQSAGGGGDYEEAMQEAMIRAANQPWRENAVKSLLLVADAPPHNQDIEMTWRAAEHLRAKRVHIVPVGASGVADIAEYVMRAMAASTQSRYTFLTDDSGIGNAHAKPAIDCYLVTRLDSLLRRVIDSQISGRRIEPNRSEVIRSVGNYDAGRCILPDNYRQ